MERFRERLDTAIGGHWKNKGNKPRKFHKASWEGKKEKGVRGSREKLVRLRKDRDHQKGKALDGVKKALRKRRRRKRKRPTRGDSWQAQLKTELLS